MGRKGLIVQTVLKYGIVGNWSIVVPLLTLLSGLLFGHACREIRTLAMMLIPPLFLGSLVNGFFSIQTRIVQGYGNIYDFDFLKALPSHGFSAVANFLLYDSWLSLKSSGTIALIVAIIRVPKGSLIMG